MKMSFEIRARKIKSVIFQQVDLNESIFVKVKQSCRQIILARFFFHLVGSIFWEFFIQSK